MAPPLIVAAGTRLGVEVVGETIEGIFGLASATVTAAGEAAKGVGTAVGGALQGALSPAPVTVVNSVGMAGEAAKAKVAELEAALTASQAVVAEKETAIEATKEDITILASKVKSFEAMLVTGGNFKADAGQEQGREPKGTEKKLSAMEEVAKKRAEKSSK